eukprot:CAMPEP_0177610716 /NCGR_PEP_ID=MMETSP0419_2-20121207/19957_1 /TAXON_ID=582737 /ORGANISM="Tetraselmis sp., Strain GSL018" /LENGTH=91 /DNA_ID=CAMNT_0019106099 /DNA_START=213 /DNA_END=489 /DNA_ORIENTATION=-
MPPSQGHHVEDSGTLLGQSMGTSASALPSLDGSANVTAAEARAHARSRAALPALAVIRPRRTVEADLVTVLRGAIPSASRHGKEEEGDLLS